MYQSVSPTIPRLFASVIVLYCLRVERIGVAGSNSIADNGCHRLKFESGSLSSEPT